METIVTIEVKIRCSECHHDPYYKQMNSKIVCIHQCPVDYYKQYRKLDSEFIRNDVWNWELLGKIPDFQKDVV